MNPHMKKVTYFIETHLDDVLDLTVLAKVAGYSPYHFCRVFKLHLGESAMSYATRLKLERAASELSYGDKSMIEVALDAGYQTPTGFLKAFKIRFGMTPTAYKKSALKLSENYKDRVMNDVKIVDREEVAVVFHRALGHYEKSSDIAWKELTQKLETLEDVFSENPPSIQMNLSQEGAETLGICYDDPSVTDEKNIRYDAAIAWSKVEVKELGKYGFETKSIAGGKYAVIEYMGDYAVAEDAWGSLYAWVEENGHTFRDAPAFEKYINAWNETDGSKIQTEIYVPIG